MDGACCLQPGARCGACVDFHKVHHTRPRCTEKNFIIIWKMLVINLQLNVFHMLLHVLLLLPLFFLFCSSVVFPSSIFQGFSHRTIEADIGKTAFGVGYIIGCSFWDISNHVVCLKGHVYVLITISIGEQFFFLFYMRKWNFLCCKHFSV